MTTDYKEIVLTRNQVSLVDEADYEWITQWKWCTLWNKGLFYAFRHQGPGNDRECVYMHRMIMGLQKGDRRVVDHREPANTLDNRRANLRIASVSQNAMNSRPWRSNVSRMKGVYCRPNGKWMAQIKVNGKCIHLGYFWTIEEASQAYRNAATEHYGEFARFA